MTTGDASGCDGGATSCALACSSRGGVATLRPARPSVMAAPLTSISSGWPTADGSPVRGGRCHCRRFRGPEQSRRTGAPGGAARRWWRHGRTAEGGRGGSSATASRPAVPVGRREPRSSPAQGHGPGVGGDHTFPTAPTSTPLASLPRQRRRWRRGSGGGGVFGVGGVFTRVLAAAPPGCPRHRSVTMRGRGVQHTTPLFGATAASAWAGSGRSRSWSPFRDGCPTGAGSNSSDLPSRSYWRSAFNGESPVPHDPKINTPHACKTKRTNTRTT